MHLFPTWTLRLTACPYSSLACTTRRTIKEISTIAGKRKSASCIVIGRGNCPINWCTNSGTGSSWKTIQKVYRWLTHRLLKSIFISWYASGLTDQPPSFVSATSLQWHVGSAGKSQLNINLRKKKHLLPCFKLPLKNKDKIQNHPARLKRLQACYIRASFQPPPGAITHNGVELRDKTTKTTTNTATIITTTKWIK